MPQMGGIDLAPLIALLAIQAIRIVLYNNAGSFV
jgi:YggT family protein